MIVGKSGSGKDEAAKFLQKEFDIPQIVSYTTRDMRAGEIDGVEHHFVSKDMVPYRNIMFAYTVLGGNAYYTTISQITEAFQCRDEVSYIVDDKGVKDIIDFVNGHPITMCDVKPLSIYIDVDDETLIKRGVCSERMKRDASRIDAGDIKYDYCVDNNGTIETLRNQLDNIIKQIREDYE